jgi:ankyrin repeat protein
MNIMQAVLRNDIPAISELLIGGAGVDEPDRGGRTPLMQAAINKRIDIMKLLLDSGARTDLQDKNGWSVLYFAVQVRSAEGIKLLVSHGPTVDLDQGDKGGRTPLMQAAINQRIDIMKLLLDSGAEPDIQDRRRWSALHFAAQEQSADGIELLVSHGATIDIADSDGNTPLSTAVFNYRGNGNAVSALLRLGADRQRKNKHGVSPAGLAHKIGNYDVRKFF